MTHRFTLWLLCAGLLCTGAAFAANNPSQPRKSETNQPNEEFKAIDFKKLLGMKGFSDNALNMHFKLYEGYVKNANALSQKIRDLSNSGQDKTPEYAGLKRMYGWEFDGMRLHEYYFGALGGDGSVLKDRALLKAIEQQFGSYDKWKQDFEATGMIRGIGWAILYYDPETRRLTNTWINEHNLGHLATNVPILTLDVFEHAYIPDYGLERAKYIDAFFTNTDWKTVSDRYDRAVEKGRK